MASNEVVSLHNITAYIVTVGQQAGRNI